MRHLALRQGAWGEFTRGVVSGAGVGPAKLLKRGLSGTSGLSNSRGGRTRHQRQFEAATSTSEAACVDAARASLGGESLLTGEGGG